METKTKNKDKPAALTLWQQYQKAKSDGFDGTFLDWKEIRNAEAQFETFTK